MMDEFTIYQSSSQKPSIQVCLSDGTLWLTQTQISELLQTTPQKNTLHIKSIYQELSWMQRQLVRIPYKFVIGD